MAKLNPSIIYSLTTDLRELHEIGREMIKQIDANKIISWRYPDRASKDINIVVETELFDSGDYVLLLELIIDRLYFILSMALHKLSSLPELSINSYDCNLPKNVSKPIGISFGTLVSFLWKRLQNLNTKSFQGSVSSNTVTNSQIRKSSNELKIVCENCSSSYVILKNLIKYIEECMSELKFHSKCKECRQNCEKNIINMSQEDVMKQWSDALLLDIKHVINYSVQKSSENSIILKEINDVKNEINTVNKNFNSSQKRNQELEHSLSEMENMVKTVVLENERFSKDCYNAKQQLEIATKNCIEKDKKLNEIEKKIHEIIRKREESIELIKTEFNNQITAITAERDSFKEKYMESKEMLVEFNENSGKFYENELSLKDKIESYKQRELDLQESHTKLKSQYNSLEQAHEILKTQEDKNVIRIITLEEEKIKLKSAVREFRQREVLLLRCPDLNGPIVTQDTNGKNPLEDMKQQLEANKTRIDLLQDQNEKLKRVIDKMQYLPIKSSDK